MQEGRVKVVPVSSVRCGVNYREVPTLSLATVKLLRRALTGYSRHGGSARTYSVTDDDVLATLPSSLPQRTCAAILKLCQLVLSIATQGIINPPTVTKLEGGATDGKKYSVLAGERRWFAVTFLGWTHVEVCVREGSPTDLRILRLTENLQRDDTNPFEDGAEFFAMLETDPTLTQAELARRIGKSVAFVSQRLSVHNKTSPAVREAFEAGYVNATDVRRLCLRPASEQIREARRAAKAAERGGESSPRAPRSPSAASLETPLMDQAFEVERLACRPTHEVIESLERLLAKQGCILHGLECSHDGPHCALQDTEDRAALRGMIFALEYVLQARGDATLEDLHATA